MLLLQDLGYQHPNQDVVFDGLNLALDAGQKLALVGANGVGKSTLLQLMAGLLPPSSGRVQASSAPYYVPQHFGQFDEQTVAQALHVADKIAALDAILDGRATEQNLLLLDDDWTIEQRSHDALLHWGLAGVGLTQQLKNLSGGQKTRVFLAGIALHQPGIVLLDEPSNHLDTAGRRLLEGFIETSAATLVLVSHDRKLLHQLDAIGELSRRGLTLYGGNYALYAEQKQVESQALAHDVKSRERALRSARDTAREARERKQKLDARGQKNQHKSGLPAIVLGMRRNSAEQSASRLQGVHADKVDALANELSALRQELPDADRMKVGFGQSALPTGKLLLAAQGLGYAHPGSEPLWREKLSFQILHGERVALRGLNGTGKTTLIRLLLGELAPTSGTVGRASGQTVFIDQDYSLLHDQLTVYEQAQQFNTAGLQEHEVKIRLTRFLFSKEDWPKRCRSLSGGEKMRLLLCCLMLGTQAPDLMVLDEPTNNLDMQSLDILTAALDDYHGTLLIVSHDDYFLARLRVERSIELRR
ncbi:ABC-F family ATP-binding cassette domain-containing protein [Hymenobacter aerophilus]|uniref:ABC-F family ATP-binding cassette domain-containing protein n=1 Tax=Hymenobacter aerophilus TaxID=119644 RepID=UPI00047742B9|nr:ATP-binding cassette domain-containing protein [Hymenobacter aerophilus]